MCSGSMRPSVSPGVLAGVALLTGGAEPLVLLKARWPPLSTHRIAWSSPEPQLTSLVPLVPSEDSGTERLRNFPTSQTW